VQDLTSALQGAWGDSFNKNALDVYGQNGKYYGVPWDMGAVTFWYNKSLFAKAKITTLPTTWTDFLSMVKQLQSAGITPISIGEKEMWPGMYWWAYLAIRLGGKAAFDKAYNRTGSFADAPFVQAGQYLQQLTALNPFQKGYLGEDYTRETTEMGNSNAAMELMGQWALANDAFAAADKKGPDMGIFPFPMIEGGAGNPTDVLGGGGGYAIGKNAPPEAIDFVKFLTSPANERILGADGTAQPPVKGAESSVKNPLKQQITQMVNNANYFQLFYDQYLPPAVGQVILDQTQGLYAHTVTPQAAAKAIDDSVASSLNQ
jgi:raffinose/stachyose/melibiose transport system substrate-binding protein